jgi:ABC-type transporter MlaC component
MNKQQTAVDNLYNQMYKIIEFYAGNEQLAKCMVLRKQAKEMERQQIIEAYHQGVTDEYGDALEFGDNTDGEVYYNEIYGNK